ncbi:MAG: MBL fold metallo-hydrolase [Thermodesulfobacteriota bacterium]
MRLCTLASGSSGNSLFIESNGSKILVDAGISMRQIKLRLELLEVDISDIDAVIITHEHSDHTHAINRLNIPTYVTSSIVDLWKDKVKILKEFASDCSFDIKDFLITPFSVPHDAVDPVGFTIETADSNKVGIVTDIGCATSLVKQRLRGCNALLLEYNHDSEILNYSHYPWDLKQRIKGRLGHLSNGQASELLQELMHDGLRHVILGHLSQVNNKPEVAYRAAQKVVKKNGAESGVGISVAPRKTIGEVVEL